MAYEWKLGPYEMRFATHTNLIVIHFHMVGYGDLKFKCHLFNCSLIRIKSCGNMPANVDSTEEWKHKRKKKPETELKQKCICTRTEILHTNARSTVREKSRKKNEIIMPATSLSAGARVTRVKQFYGISEATDGIVYGGAGAIYSCNNSNSNKKNYSN